MRSVRPRALPCGAASHPGGAGQVSRPQDNWSIATLATKPHSAAGHVGHLRCFLDAEVHRHPGSEPRCWKGPQTLQDARPELFEGFPLRGGPERPFEPQGPRQGSEPLAVLFGVRQGGVAKLVHQDAGDLDRVGFGRRDPDLAAEVFADGVGPAQADIAHLGAVRRADGCADLFGEGLAGAFEERSGEGDEVGEPLVARADYEF